MKSFKNFWLFLLRTLQDVPGAVRESVIYASVHTNKYVADARDGGGRVVPVPFEHTVVSGELGGASAGVSDEVNLCVLPANCEVVGLQMVHEGFAISAGVGVTFDIGDSGDPNRYYVTGDNPEGADEDIAGSIGKLAVAGMKYRPTADTIVLLQWGVANPVVGQIIKGCFYITPGV